MARSFFSFFSSLLVWSTSGKRMLCVKMAAHGVFPLINPKGWRRGVGGGELGKEKKKKNLKEKQRASSLS